MPGNVLVQASGLVANSAPLQKVKGVEGDGCGPPFGQTVGSVAAGDRAAARAAGDHDHAAFAGLLGGLHRIHSAHELPARVHKAQAV